MNTPEKLIEFFESNLERKGDKFSTENINTNFKLLLFEEIKKNSNLPDCANLIFLNQHIAHMAGTYRAHIPGNDGTPKPINYYSLLFMDSGSGKDTGYRALRNSFHKYYENLMKIYEFEFERYQRELEEHAIKSNMNKKDKAEYMRVNNIKKMLITYGSGTVEGVHSYGATCSKLRQGGLSFFIDEFGSFLKNPKEEQLAFLENAIIPVYDAGEIVPKMIKGSSNNQNIYGLHVNFHGHTDLSGLQGSKSRKTLDNMLSSGMIRRCYIGYPETRRIVKKYPSFDQFEIDKKTRQENGKILSPKAYALLCSYIDIIHKEFQVVLTGEVGNEKIKKHVMEWSEKAEWIYEIYRLWCKNKSTELYRYNLDMEKEFSNKHWKMLKLAGLNAFINHPKEKIIKEDDLIFAIIETEFFSQYSAKFCVNKHVKKDHEKLFEFIMEKTLTNGGATKSELRKLDCTPSANLFRKYWEGDTYKSQDGMENIVKEFALHQGYYLKMKRIKANEQKYYTEKIVNVDLSKVRLSKSMETTKAAVNFDSIKIGWNSFKMLTNTVTKYSNFSFLDNYRNQANSLKQCDFIMIDFDSGQTIKEVESKLENYRYYIQPSKSHMIPKEMESARERFHVHILLETPMKVENNQHYKNIMTNICKGFGFDVDEKCHEIARYFDCSEHQGWYGSGEELLDWTLFDTGEEPSPINKAAEPIIYSSNSKKQENGFIDGYQEKLNRYIKSVETYFNSNFYQGNRNQTVYTMFMRGVEGDGLDETDVRNILQQANKNSGIPLPDREFKLATRERR